MAGVILRRAQELHIVAGPADGVGVRPEAAVGGLHHPQAADELVAAAGAAGIEDGAVLGGPLVYA